jgi:hypothetical protein
MTCLAAKQCHAFVRQCVDCLHRIRDHATLFLSSCLFVCFHFIYLLVNTRYTFDTRLAVIGSELVTYSAVNASGLVGCVRGALGTSAAAHTAGAQVGHLAQMYGELLARPGTPLFEKIATRLADVYNGCGFDAVYFDGSEGTAALGSEQIPISMFEELFYSKLNRDILVEGSSIVSIQSDENIILVCFICVCFTTFRDTTLKLLFSVAVLLFAAVFFVFGASYTLCTTSSLLPMSTKRLVSAFKKHKNNKNNTNNININNTTNTNRCPTRGSSTREQTLGTTRLLTPRRTWTWSSLRRSKCIGATR